MTDSMTSNERGTIDEIEIPPRIIVHGIEYSSPAKVRKEVTEMRNACVEKVKAMGDRWNARVANSGDETFKYHYRTRADAATEIAAALEFLQVEQEKQS